MRNVPIEIFPIAKTQVDREAVRRWLDHLEADQYEIPSEETCTDPALLIALAAKRCYLSFQPSLNPNVTKVRTDLVEYLDNILKSGHGSVLEHAVWTFAIEGVSRVFTGEMNRHRAGVGISEASMRYIRYTDIPWWLPTSITLTSEESEAVDIGKQKLGLSFNNDEALKVYVHPQTLELTLEEPYRSRWTLALKKLKTQCIFNRHFGQTETNYGDLQDVWADELAPTSKFTHKKHITSMMRRIIPMGVATGGVWTLNIRAARHIIALRASSAAEEEILCVFSRIAKIMTEDEPMLFGDFSESGDYWVPRYPKV